VEIAVCALRFLYSVALKQAWAPDDVIPAPKKPRRLPVVLSRNEMARRYLRIATTSVCATASPLDLLPHPTADRPWPAPADHP
jgi:hypothetical protein